MTTSLSILNQSPVELSSTGQHIFPADKPVDSHLSSKLINAAYSFFLEYIYNKYSYLPMAYDMCSHEECEEETTHKDFLMPVY